MHIKPIGKLMAIMVVVGAIGYFGSSYLEKQETTAAQSSPVVATKATKQEERVTEPVDSKSPIGSKKNPLKVSLVSFHGYAPGLMANGGLKTESGTINDRNGVNVELLLQDDIPTLATLFGSNVAHCAWRTSDFWAQEHPNLKNAKGNGKGVMVVDNTQGGDAVIARDPNIRSIEDLAGKTVALLQYTPSHGMLIDAIENSSLTVKKKQSIKMIFINTDEGTSGVRAAYESNKVDAAVIWDPDLALALRSGGHVVYSTKQASNLIYDIIVCDTKVINDPNGEAAIEKFVAGWMQGVEEAKNNTSAAVATLVKNEEMFALLQKKEGASFIKSLFPNVKWTGLDDNVRILGMGSDANHYERVYKQFDQIYRTAGTLANPNSPVINPQDSFDYRFIKKLVALNPSVMKAAEKTIPVFNQAELTRVSDSTAVVTKPVMVTFNTGTGELTQRAKKQIDVAIVPFLENNGSSYIEISGNTDSVGSNAVNIPLSNVRAKSVVNYLVEQWGYPVSRFKVVGNGSSKPICDESSKEMALDLCREMNRSTRVAILGR
jgi:outer membrane protein OmpA-like peptidoglycan-associated protein